jgi:hypothetical protein
MILLHYQLGVNMKNLSRQEMSWVAGGSEVSNNFLEPLGGSGGSLMDAAGLNSSGAFSGIDQGDYGQPFSAGGSASGGFTVMDSIIVGAQTAYDDCFSGIKVATTTVAIISVVQPEVTIGAPAAAGIGCGAGLIWGIGRGITNF